MLFRFGIYDLLGIKLRQIDLHFAAHKNKFWPLFLEFWPLF
jgi:hypothetical protein